MPIQSGKYVTPAWQNGGAPAITAEELTAIGQSIEQNQDDIEQNATDIQTANNNIQTANNNIQQNAQDIDSLQTWQSTVNGQISSIQSGYLQKTGGTMTGILNMGNKRITNLATPSSGADAANKNYVDNNFLSQMTLVQTETFSFSTSTENSKTQSYDFNPAFTNLQTSYQIIAVAVSGSFMIEEGSFSVFGHQLLYPSDNKTYTIDNNSPMVILLTKGGIDYPNELFYFLLPPDASNKVSVKYTSGESIPFKVGVNRTKSANVNATIKLYGWNPI